jgi:hypothetical protein
VRHEIELPAAMVIGDVAALHARLAPFAAGAVALRAGSVRRIDTAGLQLLAAFVAGREDVRWESVSSELAAAAHLLGMRAALRLPEASP